MIKVNKDNKLLLEEIQKTNKKLQEWKWEDERLTHVHYNWNIPQIIVKIFTIFMMFIIVTSIISWGTHVLTYKEQVYDSCVGACKYKGYEGYKLGIDNVQSSPVVIQYDRDDCVKQCNELYITI